MNQSASKHIPILDGIRAYAVLLVCIVHFFQINESSLYQTSRLLGSLLFKISELGLKGVELFFILSGFLITGILLDSKKSSKYFTTFYARRFLRIFPLYYFVLFVSFLILPRLFTIDSAGVEVIRNQAWLWTYTSNLSTVFGQRIWDLSVNFPWFGHFWSLCVEEHFYLLWPLLIYISGEKWLPRVMWSIVIFSFLSVLFVYFFDEAVPLLKWSTISYAGVLSSGGLIAWYIRKPERFAKLSVISLKLVWPSGILFILVNFIPRKYEIHQVATFFSSVVFFTLLLATSLRGTRLTDKLFNHSILFFIGKVSYGIYVYHGLLRPYLKTYLYEGLISQIHNGILSIILYTVISTTISIIIAWASWVLIESPVLKIKKIFNY